MTRPTSFGFGAALVSTAVLMLTAPGCSPKNSPKPGAPAPQNPPSSATSAPVAAPLADHSQAAVPVRPSDLTFGPADAKVTLVEFLDMQCPFCARVQPTVKRLQAKYGSDLRVVVKHQPLPFHDRAYDAALAVATVRALAGNPAAQQFVDLLLEKQSELSDSMLESLAERCGVARVVYQEAITSRRFARLVDDDLELAKTIGAQGTPGFFINGVHVEGAQPFESFVATIDAQMLAADELLGHGAARASIYNKLVDQNFQKVTPPEAMPEAPPDRTVWRIPVSPDDPMLGPGEAPVTVVVFSDFECPFCARAHATLKQVVQHYGPKVRLIWKDNPLPFHPQAQPAAILGRQLFTKKGGAAFWEYADRVFGAQTQIEATLRAESKSLGLSFADLAKGKGAKAVLRKIEHSQEEAADFEVRGTPHFFINGVRLEGAKPLEAFVAQIDSALAEAAKLESQGVTGARIYESLTKDGKLPAEPERKAIALSKSPRPSRGSGSAAVTLQVFSDFECPFCKRVEPTLTQLEKDFPGKLRIIWRHMPLPFHEHASLAAQAAEAAFAQKGAKAFWAFHDRLFANQSVEGGLERAQLDKIAAELSLDMPAFQKALDQGTYVPTIEADMQAARAADITGTPATSIGPYFLSGAQPLSAFRRAIRLALREGATHPAPSHGVPSGAHSGPK